MITTLNIPNKTQEGKVLEALKKGGWVNKQYFIRELYLTQAGRAIYNLENDPKWQREYTGYYIEHSPFKDEHNFKSYKLTVKDTLF